MSFATDIKADLDKLLAAAEFGESIRYKPDGGSFSAAFNVFVENEGEEIGVAAHNRRGPIFVTASK